jgi:hypothetical protein
MNKRIEIIRIFNNMLIMFAISAVVSLGMGALAGKTLVLACTLLAAFVLFSEVVQAFVNNLILFLLSHIMGIGVVLFSLVYIFTSSYEFSRVEIDGVQIWKFFIVLFGIFMLIVMVLGIATRVDKKGRFYPEIAEAILFIVLFLFCKITRCRSGETVVLVCELIWGLLATGYYNAKQVINALITYHDGDFVPYEQIRKNNGTMLKISLAVAGIGMLLCTAFDYGKELLAVIKSVIVGILRWFFSLFTFEPVEEVEIQKPEVQSDGFGQLLPEAYVDDSIWHKIWNALFWVAAVFVTALIIYLVVKLIRQFYKLFNDSKIGIRDRLNRDKKEFLSPLKGDNETTFGTGAKDRLTFVERLSKRGRIRLLFVKYVEKGRNFADIKNSNTPSEIERISLDKTAAAYEIYEKARYSTKDISDEDLSQMKALTRAVKS